MPLPGVVDSPLNATQEVCDRLVDEFGRFIVADDRRMMGFEEPDAPIPPPQAQGNCALVETFQARYVTEGVDGADPSGVDDVGTTWTAASNVKFTELSGFGEAPAPWAETVIAHDGTLAQTGWFRTDIDTSLSPAGTVEWMIEAWIYLRNSSETAAKILSLENSLGERVNIYHDSVNKISAEIVNQGGTIVNISPGTDPMRVDTWTHIAFVRDNDAGEFKFYVNGRQQITAPTQSLSFSNNDWRFGSQLENIGGNLFCITGLRVRVGDEVYRENFTPRGKLDMTMNPIFTACLLNFEGGVGTLPIVDDSRHCRFAWFSQNPGGMTNPPLITGPGKFGTGKWQGNDVGPGIDSARNTGEGEFNGVFQVPVNEDFCLEGWFRFSVNNGTNSFRNVCLFIGGFNYNVCLMWAGLRWGLNINGNVFEDFSYEYLDGFDRVVNQWYHIAITKTGSQYTMFIDGSEVFTADLGPLVEDITDPYGSFTLTAEWRQEIAFDSLRYTVGTTVYSGSTFTVTEGDNGYNRLIDCRGVRARTQFLHNYNDTIGQPPSTPDETGKVMGLVNAPTIITGLYGTGALGNAGVAQQLDSSRTEYTNLLDINGDVQICAEGFGYMENLQEVIAVGDGYGSPAFFALWNAGFNGLKFFVDNNLSGKMKVEVVDDVNGSQFALGSIDISDDTWFHYCIIKDGATIRTFIDGVLDATLNLVSPNLVYGDPAMSVWCGAGGPGVVLAEPFPQFLQFRQDSNRLVLDHTVYNPSTGPGVQNSARTIFI